MSYVVARRKVWLSQCLNKRLVGWLRMESALVGMCSYDEVTTAFVQYRHRLVDIVPASCSSSTHATATRSAHEMEAAGAQYGDRLEI